MIRRLLVLLSILGVIISLASCRLEKAHEGRVIVLAMDGLDPHAIDLLMSEGKLPNFAKMKTDGAYAPLLSQKPLLSPVVWTTVATGKTPDQHRIGHFVAINPQTGEQLPVTSQMRKTRALWNILSDAGRSVAVTGWWATWPAETVNGSIVSDHVAYHFLFDQGLEENQDKPGLTYPAELRDEIAPLVVKPADVSFETISRYLDIAPEELDKPFDFQDPVAHFRWALAASDTYKNIGLHLWSTKTPDNLFVYIEGVDSTSHLFGHVFRNDSLAGELAEQKARYGRAVEQMYIHADEILGEFIEAMDDDTTIVVLSDHGFELGAVLEDPSMSRDFRRVSEKYHRLRGVLYLYGRDVARGSVPNPSILDIAPTILALNGMPAAADMSGRVLQTALDTTAPDRIPTYEPDAPTQQAASTETSGVDAEVLEKLRSLGYLGATSPTGDASLAMVLFEQGRYEEAAAAFEKLMADSPDNPDLRVSYAGVLGQLGRYDEAIAQLDTAISMRPLSPQAYHNRAVAYERKGDIDAAVADYRRALRYGNFGPSLDALTRLGVSPSTDTLDERETRAVQLAEEAANAARRGDYPSAQRLLDEAERVAPDFSLVHQYRSNVAYLAGDIDGAIRALERGLELEPDNVLFRENLKTLRARKAAAQP
jgi:predicted AlkP superfamily phosphohydrolase/phosphomutase/Flp pilus assembly protein TadD